MKHPLRPYRLVLPAMVLATSVALAPPGSHAQTTQFAQALHRLDPFISHSSSQGYLGVMVADVDNEAANRLKLKDAHGALVTLIDHDAPAGSALRVNDVVLEINGQRIEGADQFGRMLREVPAGHSVAILLTRDGAPVTVSVQLVDRKVMEQTVWQQIGNRSEGGSSTSPGKAILPGGDAGLPRFHGSIFGSTLKVGAMVEPLTSQTAEYLGVPAGIIVKQVARKSEADTAGLKPFDVVLKVGNDPITTIADWDRAIRSNEGKSVTITIVRDRKQQTVILQVDSKHKGELTYPGLLPDGPAPLLAEENELALPEFAAGSESIFGEQASPFNDDFNRQAEELGREARNLRDSLGQENFGIDARQMEQLQQQMDQFRKNFKPEDFGIDQNQISELKKQMEEFRQSFKAQDFGIDPRQMDELKKQMEEFRQNFDANSFKIDPKQMDELNRQMQEFRKSMPLFKPNRLEQKQHPQAALLCGQQA